MPTTTISAGRNKAHPALLATRPPIHPLAVSEASGLEKRMRVTTAAVSPAEVAASVVLSAIKTVSPGFHAGKQDRACGIQTQPSQPGQQTAEEDQDNIVPGNGRGHAVIRILSAARSQNPCHGQSGQAPDYLNGAGAAGVHKAVAESGVGAQLRQPSAAPNPMRE